VLIVGLGVALLCALASNVAFLCRHRGASSVPPVEWRRPLGSAKSLWLARWFAIGMGVALVAWLLHIAAMALAPITLVQVAISAGLVSVAVLAERMFGVSVGRRQWLAVVILAAGLAMFSGAVPTPKNAHSDHSTVGMIAFQAALLGFGAFCMASRRLAGSGRYALLLGIAAGGLFSASDAALKVMTRQLGDDGAAGILGPWLVACLAASVMGFYASARSLQDEDAVAVISLTTVASTVATFIGGAVVFRDPMASNPMLLALQMAGLVCVCVAAALIPAPVRAREHVAEEPEESAPPERRGEPQRVPVGVGS
jgi:drug/metabolite transporter (DMT)-like permease